MELEVGHLDSMHLRTTNGTFLWWTFRGNTSSLVCIFTVNEIMLTVRHVSKSCASAVCCGIGGLT